MNDFLTIKNNLGDVSIAFPGTRPVVASTDKVTIAPNLVPTKTATTNLPPVTFDQQWHAARVATEAQKILAAENTPPSAKKPEGKGNYWWLFWTTLGVGTVYGVAKSSKKNPKKD